MDRVLVNRCEHGFVTCYPCKHSAILPGCYVPECDNQHDWRDKMCPKHGGRAAAHYNEETEK